MSSATMITKFGFRGASAAAVEPARAAQHAADTVAAAHHRTTEKGQAIASPHLYC